MFESATGAVLQGPHAREEMRASAAAVNRRVGMSSLKQ